MSNIQGKRLDVTVSGCDNLVFPGCIPMKNVCVAIQYGGTEYRTRICAGGGKDPLFQKNFKIPLVEGLRYFDVQVLGKTLFTSNLIGSGKIQLQEVINTGYDNAAWPIRTYTGRFAGEVLLIMHYPDANRLASNNASSAPPYGAAPPQTVMHAGEFQVTHANANRPASFAPSAPQYPAGAPIRHYPGPPLSSAYSTPSSNPAYPPTPYSGLPSAYSSTSYPPPSQEYTSTPGSYHQRLYRGSTRARLGEECAYN